MKAVKQTFHTKPEQCLFEALQIVYPPPYEICPKVRLADLIVVDERWTPKEQKFILMAHVDVAVVVSNRPIVAFEYDGYTHKLYPAQQKRDALKDDLCCRGGLRLIRIPEEIFTWQRERIERDHKTPVQILVSLLKGARAFLERGQELRELLDWLDSYPQFMPGELDLAGLAAMVDEHDPDAVKALLQRRLRQDDLRDELDIMRHLLGENREMTELRLAMRRDPRYKPLAKLIELTIGSSLTPDEILQLRERVGDGNVQVLGSYLEEIGRMFAGRLVASAYLDEDDDLCSFVTLHFKAYGAHPLIELQRSLSQLAKDRCLTVGEAIKALKLGDESEPTGSDR